jgi:hypothetical protein
MSAQELRTRIEELSSEIALQKRLLTKLEQDKSVAQGQLNAVIDPVAQLPLEISTEIFSNVSSRPRRAIRPSRKITGRRAVKTVTPPYRRRSCFSLKRYGNGTVESVYGSP